MQTALSPEFQRTDDGRLAEQILRKCVHCGFCLATCPTYQLLGNELDSPRGRIYLIKQVLEGKEPTRATQQHLDRCLTCRNCETTCPSGVDYGRLVDIGRRTVEARVRRPWRQRLLRWLLREGLTSAWFGHAVSVGSFFRPMLPAALASKLPRRTQPVPPLSAEEQSERVLLLAGCVQPALLPTINAATIRVLASLGIQTVIAPDAGCCGAIREHGADHGGALDDMRRNIDAWWPLVSGADGAAPVRAIVVNASGCGVTVKEYGHLLARDARYAHKASVISACARDLAEFLEPYAARLQPRVEPKARGLAVHLPCTLQHGQRLPDLLPRLLRDMGFAVALAPESHLCCGSAGTYSVLEPELATRLRDRKLGHLHALQLPRIVSANVGCILHLQGGTALPVRHWIEVIDEAMVGSMAGG